MIIEALKKANSPMTSYQLSKAIKDVEHKHIASSLHHMVKRRFLKRRSIDDPNNEGRTCYAYTIEHEPKFTEKGRVTRKRHRRSVAKTIKAYPTYMNGKELTIQPLLVLQYGDNESLTLKLNQAHELWVQLQALQHVFKQQQQ